jgi:LEA14-like dessication related protein
MKSFQKIFRFIGVSGLLLSLLAFMGCATARDIARILKPDVHLKDVHLASLSFDAADLVIDVGIENLNPLVPIALTGVDYDLKINDISFLKGQQPQQLQIDPGGGTVFQIPVTLNYKNLYETFQSLKDQDMTAYNVDCGLSFDLPGLGAARVPLAASGEFPAIKLPSISVDGLKVKKVNVAGADMELQLRMDNPNAFDVLLNNFDYELMVNGKSWAKGFGKNQIQVGSKAESAITIPISMDFAQIGFSVYQMLSGGEQFDYSFKGNLDVGSSLPLLQQATLPFNKSGALNIHR